MKQLKAALLGLGGVGLDYLTTIQAHGRFELLAVADRDSQIVSRFTEGTTMIGHTDYRSLIVETRGEGLDVLFVALEPYESREFVELAARHGIHVFHKAPLARTVSEARNVMRCFADNPHKLTVAQAWKSVALTERIEQFPHQLGRLFTASASVMTCNGSQGWRGDLSKAGGGVLLNEAFDLIDFLVQMLGVPETVYGQCVAKVAPGEARNYDTEDAASVSLRFSEDRSATLHACRSCPEARWRVELAGTLGHADLSNDGLRIIKQGAEPGDLCRIAPHVALADQIGLVAHSELPSPAVLRAHREQHLASLAVIEATYLSAKTGTPEPPSQFLDL